MILSIMDVVVRANHRKNILVLPVIVQFNLNRREYGINK